MGDSGASGVIGALAIVVIFGLAVFLGIAFVLTMRLRAGQNTDLVRRHWNLVAAASHHRRTDYV